MARTVSFRTANSIHHLVSLPRHLTPAHNPPNAPRRPRLRAGGVEEGVGAERRWGRVVWFERQSNAFVSSNPRRPHLLAAGGRERRLGSFGEGGIALGGLSACVGAPAQTKASSSGRSWKTTGGLWRGVGWACDLGVRACACADHDPEQEESCKAAGGVALGPQPRYQDPQQEEVEEGGWRRMCTVCVARAGWDGCVAGGVFQRHLHLVNAPRAKSARRSNEGVSHHSEYNEALHSGSGINFFDDSGEEPLKNLVFLLFRYVHRSLTYEYDLINGFSGLLRQLAIQMKSGLLEGVHTSSFDIGILLYDLYPKQGIFARHHGFPSWSWAGWHRECFGFSGYCGDTAQANRWLSMMTYIDWYKHEPGTLKLGLVWDFGTTKEYDNLTENHIGYRATPANPYGHSFERLFMPELRDDEEMREDIRSEIGDRSYHVLQFWAQVAHFAALDDPDKFDMDSDRDDPQILGQKREGYSAEISGPWACIFKILDSQGAICGGIKLDDPSLVRSLEGSHEFILLSRVDRYEDFFNNAVKTDRPMYWVFVIEWIGSKKVVAERRGVGFIFWDCLRQMFYPGKGWKEIVLA
ncbi:hypothetical protein CVT26_012019 [Gymnopilus dilepis]|uniref:Uncharacterized protein n=1 Tax=Gymnopilus dilepis TaxID=231916 RepID=A0A409YHQ2_9AGAR|nr:hypothetical protein CVT26_012019 [Gymnopilus dilepis]